VFRTKAKSDRFVLARSSDQTHLGLVKRRYQRSLELALIISLTGAILAIRLLSSVRFEKLLVRADQIKFESIDIIDIPPLIEDRPKFKMEEVVEIPPEEETSEESALAEEIEDLLEKTEDDMQLTLNSNDLGKLLITSSQLGAVTSSDLDFRTTRTDYEGNINLKNNKFYGDGDGGGLDIGKTKSTSPRVNDDNIGLELQTKPVAFGKNEPAVEKRSEPKLGISDVPERIISFASSTFGTEDYKLWNKINAELDRLNKGRYGSVPDEIKRVRGGFLMHLTFPDGTRQEIHWENAGNVWIKIIGNSKHTSVQELRRALDGLIKITLGS